MPSQLRVGVFGEPEEMIGVAASEAKLIVLAPRARDVLSDGLEHQISGAAIDLDDVQEGLRHEGVQQLERVELVSFTVDTHRVGGGEIEPSGEHTDIAKQELLRRR